MEQGSVCASLEKPCTALTVDDVYEIAKLIGSEIEKLIDGYGKASVEGLVPKIVKVLEIMERFAARNQEMNCKENELLKAYETLQTQHQKSLIGSDVSSVTKEMRQLDEKEQSHREASEKLQAEVQQLQVEKQELLEQLKWSQAQEGRAQEREVMLKLKAVVDKQRDEIRAKAQEIARVTKEAEALQEQLERFMKMNAELRHKQSVAQAQVKSAVERRADMEADLREKQKEIERLTSWIKRATAATAANAGSSAKTEIDLTDKIIIDLKDPNRPCFTKQEVRDMIFERNELKANLFLVQEELTYYQREILNEERCPGFLLNAVRSAMKKQRTVIKAKMLGIAEDECSSDEVDAGSLSSRRESQMDENCADSQPPESRIRSLFGFLTRSSLSRGSCEPSSASSWEIIGTDEMNPATDPSE